MTWLRTLRWRLHTWWAALLLKRAKRHQDAAEAMARRRR